MKSFVIILLGVLMFSASASARCYDGYYHRRGGCYAADVTAGIVGTAAGVVIAEEIMEAKHTKRDKPTKKVHIYEPEGKCFTFISRKTGEITQKCVENASEEIIYID